MSNVVIFNGSARKNGNTSKLVDAFVRGASPKHSITIFNLAEMDIHPCRACNACFDNEDLLCIHKDDMQKIYHALAKADIVVVATPVYLFGISAQMKLMLDRLHVRGRKNFRVKEIALFVVAGSSKKEMFDPVLLQYKMLVEFFGLESLGTVLVGNTLQEEIGEDHPALAQAQALGETIE